jgi:regulator of RNase E activity RraA
MTEWKNDQELFELITTELFSCVIGDVLDALGYTRQYFPPSVRPLHPDARVVGRAMTVLGSPTPAGAS